MQDVMMIIARDLLFIVRRGCLLLTVGAALLFVPPAFSQSVPVVQLVKDINPGSEGSDAAAFVKLNGVAYFRATDSAHGYELWRTDGTDAGTEMVIDLNPGSVNGFPDSIAAVNGALYFNAFDTADFTGSKAWRSDGTAAGTTLLADTYPGLVGGGIFGPPLPGNFFALDASTILFTALDPEGGLEPWKTDGTAEGTSRIIDLHPGPEWSIPIEFTDLRDVTYFAADDSVVYHHDGTATYNRELFRTDGTAEGTFRVKDINPGPDPSTPTDFIRYNHFVFFSADDGVHGTELWRTDGTDADTVQVADINPGASGSTPQYPIIARFQPAQTAATSPNDRSGARDVLLFLADDGTHGLELFRSDGTAEGTYLVKDINSTGDSVPLGMVEYKGRVYFSADDGVHGSEVWVTDGTEAGTQLFADLNPGALRSSPQEFTVAGGRLFFVAIVPDDPHFTVRTQLWETDGTAERTELVYEEPGNDFGYGINNLTVLGNKLLFTAPNGIDQQGFSTDTELFAASME
ncbi:MAG TPA: ELWxxDGT repeat protein [Chthoniobacterales bacterium]